jgi:sugar phosphate isomerase/epimerase
MRVGAMNNPRTPLLEEIAWFGANGFDYVDLTVEAPGAAPESTDWRAVRAAIADAGLGVVCHAPPYLPVENPSPLVRQAALDELRRCVDVAQIVGAPLCTTHFTGWPRYLSDNQGYEYYRQLYAILAQHGQERGVAVALENMPDAPHQLKHFREIFQRVPGLLLLYDAAHGNVKTARSQTRDYLFALADRLAHVHLSDNDGKADLHLPFGAPMRGGLDLAHELRELRTFGYDGTITLEVFGDRRWLLLSRDLLREAWQRAE